MQQGLSEDLYHRVHEYTEIEAFSEAEKLAAELAERFVFDHENIDDVFWERVRATFDDQEILELLTTIGFCLGIGRTLAILDVANDCPLNLTAEPDPEYIHAHG